ARSPLLAIRHAPPRGHPLGAHQPARPARRRRRGRHERLHRRGLPPPGRAGHRGRDLHAGHLQRPPAGGRDEPGRDGPSRQRRPLRGPRQGGASRAAVRLHRGRPARGGTARAGLLRRHPLALLALRPGRLAGPRPVERAADPHGAHPGQGQERGAGCRRPPRTPRPRHRRAAGRRRGRPADRQHRRGGPPAGPPLRRRPGPHPRRPPRGGPGAVLPWRPGGGPPRYRCSRGRPGPPLRGAHPAAEGPRRPAARRRPPARRRPLAPRPAAGARGRRAQRLRPRGPRAAAQAGRRPRHRRRRHLLPATAAGPARRALPRGRRHRGPEPQRVLRPGRARVAGLRHPRGRRRRRRAAHRGSQRRLRRARRRPRPPRLRRGGPVGAGPPRAALRRGPAAREPVLLGPHRRRPRRCVHLRRRGDGPSSAAAALGRVRAAARPAGRAGGPV
ncbi:MAG: D-inositol-3-phosphate glycosyltransferase, partial [uncultured Blastococcus sp.]